MNLSISIALAALIVAAFVCSSRTGRSEEVRRAKESLAQASRENGRLRDRLAVSVALAFSDSAVKYHGLVLPFVSGCSVYGCNRNFAFRAGVSDAVSRGTLSLAQATSGDLSGKAVDMLGEWDSAGSFPGAVCHMTADDFRRVIRSSEKGAKCVIGENAVWVVVPGEQGCVMDLRSFKLIYLAMVASEADCVKIEYDGERAARFSVVPEDALVSFPWRVVFVDRADLSGDKMCGDDECVVCAEDGRILHASYSRPVPWASLRSGEGRVG